MQSSVFIEDKFSKPGSLSLLGSVVKLEGTGWNGVPQPVSGVPPSDIAVSPPIFLASWFSGKSLKLLPPEVRF